MTAKFRNSPNPFVKIARSLGMGAFILPLYLSGTVLAESNNLCPNTTANEDIAQNWSVVLDENEWMHRATLMTDATALMSPIEFWLEIDGAVDIAVLDWYFPPIYDGRIGVLHYFSGAAGTSAMAEFTRIAVVDTLTSALIANPMYSTLVSGARYIEQDDGTTIEQNYYYCDLAEIEWLSDRFTVTFDDEETVYTLPENGLY